MWSMRSWTFFGGIGFNVGESSFISTHRFNLCTEIRQWEHNIDGQPILRLLHRDFGGCYRVCSEIFRIKPMKLMPDTGWITTAAWCFACSGPPSILANIITSLVIFNNENYVPERWHTSLIMIATMIIPFTFNLWFRKVLDSFEMFGGILHIGLFIVFLVILIVFGPRSDTDFVFKTLTYETSGWNSPGVSWGIGLLSMTFAVTGADSVLHMCK
jgi:amino acid transporter